MKKLAIVGSGVAGLGAAWLLREKFDISVFEAGDYAGGHTHTVDVPLPEGGVQPVDTGFIVFNEHTYPNLLNLFRGLGVPYADSQMSFAHYNTRTGLQWCSQGLGGLFAQRKNIFSPQYIRFLLEANRFNSLLPKDLERNRASGSFGDYLKRNGFSDFFVQNYIVPMTAAVWSFTRRRMASRSPKGTCETPGSLWPKPSQYARLPVMATAPMVRPWNDDQVATMLVRSTSPRP